MKLLAKIKAIQSSNIFKGLFGPSSSPVIFSDSILGHLVDKLYFPNMSLVLVLGAVFIYWYEVYIGQYVPLLGRPAVAPLLILLAVLFAKKSAIRLEKPLLWYGLFLVFSFLSGLIAVGWGSSVVMIILGWSIYALFGLEIVIGQSLDRKGTLLHILPILFLPNVLVALWQYFVRPEQLFPVFGEAGGRAVGLLTNPNVFGMIAVLVTLISFWQVLERNNRLYILSLAVNFLGVFVSGSRTSWLALMVGTVILLAWYIPKKLKYVPFALVILLAPRVRSRLLDLFSSEYGYQASVDGRVWTLNNGMHIWAQKPVLGFGPGSYGGKLATYYQSPVALLGLQNGYSPISTTDNAFIELIVQLGLIGFFAFLGFAVSLFTHFYAKKNIYSPLAVAVFASFVVMMLTSNTLEFNAVAAPMAVIAGLALSG